MYLKGAAIFWHNQKSGILLWIAMPDTVLVLETLESFYDPHSYTHIL